MDTPVMDPVNCNYRDFVALLAKPMATIVDDLLHMSIGMSGELGEHEEAAVCTAAGFPVDPNETVEVELGDYKFYMTGMANFLGVDVSYNSVALDSIKILSMMRSDNCSYAGNDVYLRIMTSRLLDKVKKLWVYKRELTDEVRKELQLDLRMCAFLHHQVCISAKLTEAELQESNRKKLLKRFEGGKYSDAAALARVDKVQEDNTGGNNPPEEPPTQEQ